MWIKKHSCTGWVQTLRPIPAIEQVSIRTPPPHIHAQDNIYMHKTSQQILYVTYTTHPNTHFHETSFKRTTFDFNQTSVVGIIIIINNNNMKQLTYHMTLLSAIYHSTLKQPIMCHTHTHVFSSPLLSRWPGIPSFYLSYQNVTDSTGRHLKYFCLFIAHIGIVLIYIWYWICSTQAICQLIVIFCISIVFQISELCPSLMAVMNLAEFDFKCAFGWSSWKL